MSFDRNQALQCARIAKHVYTFEDQNLAPLGNPTFVPINDSRAAATSFAGLYVYPQHVVVAYRGTMPSIPDWLKNFQTRLVATELGGKVHQGFKDELLGVQPSIDSGLKSRGLQSRPLIITGHSQGGGIAALAARQLELSGYKVSAAYTFAAPRPGDSEFRNSIQAPLHRMEYGNDIVPHVPPPKALGKLLSGWTMRIAAWFANPIVKILAKMAQESTGYVSAGRLTYAPESGEVQFSLNEAQESDLMKQRVWWLLRGGGRAIEHHSMDRYIGSLEKP